MPRHSSRQAQLFEDARGRAVIEEIRATPSNPNVRHVRVAGRTVARLRASDIESLGLRVGGRWTPALAKRVLQSVWRERAHHEAMGLLSRRMLSERELAQRLTKRGHDAAIVRQVVRDAREAGWLNDAALADELMRGMARTKPAGRILIADKLQRRGIDDSVIVNLTKRRSTSDDADAAIDLARRRWVTMSNLEPAAAARRIAGLLLRRGFEEDIVAKAIAAIDLPGSAHE